MSKVGFKPTPGKPDCSLNTTPQISQPSTPSEQPTISEHKFHNWYQQFLLSFPQKQQQIFIWSNNRRYVNEHDFLTQTPSEIYCQTLICQHESDLADIVFLWKSATCSVFSRISIEHVVSLQQAKHISFSKTHEMTVLMEFWQQRRLIILNNAVSMTKLFNIIIPI